MQRFRKILVGIDLDEAGASPTAGSRLAASQALWIARHARAEVTLLHSTERERYFDALIGNYRLEHRAPRDEGLQAMEALCAEFHAEDLECELQLTEERPALALTHHVLRNGADLVVVAKRSMESSDGRPLGRVAKQLLQHCPTPVWAVALDGAVTCEVILAATDLTPVGDRAVALGGELARAASGTLHVVHAWQLPIAEQLARDDEQERRVAEIQTHAEEHILRRLGEDVPGLKARLHVGRHAPEHAILDGVEHLSPDLLVLGTVSRTGIAGVLVGNTAELLFERAACSMLTVKPEDFVSPVELPADEE